MKKRIVHKLLFIVLIGTVNMVQAQITGKVTDTDNVPIAFANILIEGTSIGTTTNDEGDFSIDYNPNKTTALLVSYVGFSTRRLLLTDGKFTDIAIVLSENPFQLGAVQVTARRTEETIRNVPQSVTVMSSKEIERNVATGFQDILSLVPNVGADESKAITTFTIRGIPSGAGGIGGGTPEGVYVNGVYNAKPELVNSIVNDARRLEVLRGPQGTSFGAASISGALNIVTTKPTPEDFITIGAEYGSRNYLRLRPTLNFKLGDKLFARSSFVFLEKDNAMINNNSLQENPNERISAGRLDLRYKPSDKMTFDLGLDFADEDIEPEGISIIKWNNIPGTDVPSDAIIGSLAPNVDISTTERGSYSNDGQRIADRNLFGLALNADFQLAENLNFLSISSYRYADQFLTFDLDNTNLDHLFEERDLQVRQLSQEFRLSGTSEKLNWTTGVFLMDVQSDFKADLAVGSFFDTFILEQLVKPSVQPLIAGDVTAGVTAGVKEQVAAAVNADPGLAGFSQEERDVIIAEQTEAQVASDPIQELIANETQNALATTDIDLEGKSIRQTAELREKTFGVFASAEYSLTDRLKLSGGLRFNREDKEITFSQDGIAFDIFVGGGLVQPNNPIFPAIPDADGDFLADTPISSTFSEDVITANVALNYKVNDNMNAYASYAKGYRSGGFAVRYVQNALEITQPFESEQVNNFELGVKAANASSKLFGNLALFYMDYQDMQIPIILADGSGQITTNAGSSRIFGLEADFAAYITDRFALSGGFGYNNAEFVDYSFTVGDEVTDRSGEKISTFPEYNGTLAADYYVPLNDNYRLTFRMQYRHRANINLSVNSAADVYIDAFEIDAYNLVNGRVALESDTFSFYVFSNNIFDEDYLVSAFSNNILNTPFGFNTNSIGEPFFIGAGFTYRIGK
ncbi:MAG: hypothetical protein Mars2KO_42580 [Maribacter sp.]